METVTVKDKVYQIGGLYTDSSGEIGRLKKASEKHDYPFVLQFYESHGQRTKPCKDLFVVNSEVGTITNAPIELEDGEMCRFEYENTYCMGFYSKANQTFVNFGETICYLNEAIMIDPLVSK